MRNNVFTEEVNKIDLSASNGKRTQSIQEKHAHGSSKDLVCEKKDIKCNSIIKQYKKCIKEHEEHNPNWQKFLIFIQNINN